MLRQATDTALQAPDLSVSLSLKRGRTRLCLVSSSVRGSKEIQWTFLYLWAVQAAAEPSDLVREPHRRAAAVDWP